jgi:predicted nucleotidyltransferase
MDRRELLADIKRRLVAAHGRRLRGVVLYGSEVRGEARPDSDLDVLVLLGADPIADFPDHDLARRALERAVALAGGWS